MINLFDTIRNTLVPIHKEGYVFVAAFFIASLILGWIAEPLFWVGLVLTLWCAYFFRDPERLVPQDDDLVLSPDDGSHAPLASFGETPPDRYQPQTQSLTLPAGRYYLFCSLPNHEALGMSAHLRVQ